MAVTFEFLLQEIRKEFDKLLSGPGVSWNKKGIEHILERAISNVLARNIDSY